MSSSRSTALSAAKTSAGTSRSGSSGRAEGGGSATAPAARVDQRASERGIFGRPPLEHLNKLREGGRPIGLQGVVDGKSPQRHRRLQRLGVEMDDDGALSGGDGAGDPGNVALGHEDEIGLPQRGGPSRRGAAVQRVERRDAHRPAVGAARHLHAQQLGEAHGGGEALGATTEAGGDQKWPLGRGEQSGELLEARAVERRGAREGVALRSRRSGGGLVHQHVARDGEVDGPRRVTRRQLDGTADCPVEHLGASDLDAGLGVGAHDP